MLDFPGQGVRQLAELGLAFLLSGIVGIEREMRQKSAGLRTYTLVGVAAALFTLVSKHGFDDVLSANLVILDPSRIAAQIVSGIGFIGGGVIFMRRDAVRGLTTAASVWLTAALGMACGAGLVVLAVATTVAHLVIMFLFPKLLRLLPGEARVVDDLEITFDEGRGTLPAILVLCTEARFRIHHVRVIGSGTHRPAAPAHADELPPPVGAMPVTLHIQVSGKRPVSHLIGRLGALDGVREVGTGSRDLD